MTKATIQCVYLLQLNASETCKHCIGHEREVSISVKCVPENDLDTNLHFMRGMVSLKVTCLFHKHEFPINLH